MSKLSNRDLLRLIILDQKEMFPKTVEAYGFKVNIDPARAISEINKALDGMTEEDATRIIGMIGKRLTSKDLKQ